MPHKSHTSEHLPHTIALEALLFYRGEPTKKQEIMKLLDIDEGELHRTIEELKETLEHRGITLVEHEDTITFGTTPSAHHLIEKITKAELMRDLGRAGLETLSIILYKAPIGRKDIDYIRGVNSSFILRNLLLRGLIEREETKGGRYTYKPSIDLVMHLGLSRLEDLPDYIRVKEELETFGKSEDNTDMENQTDTTH